jgi:hypothetical protein
MRAGFAVAAIAALLLAGCGGDDPPAPAAPPGFLGVAPQDPPTDVDLARMQAGGVGSYHLLLSWARVESTPGVYDWSSYDELLGKLAEAGIRPIPYVFGTPAEYADEPSVPPVRDTDALDAYEAFLTAAAARYGPDGEFWQTLERSDPEIEPQPLEIWEIWNEQNSPTFWAPEPSEREYALLLKRSSKALEEVDPEARVMVGGMFATPSSELAILSFDFLERLLAKEKTSELIDLVAVHPYGPRLGDVREQIERSRELLDEVGATETGLWVTEIGWGSDEQVSSQLTKSPDKQAELLGKTFEMLIAEREQWGIEGALWYTWRDPLQTASLCGWCASAGLVDRDLDPKPAWLEFTRLTGGEA